MKVSALNLTTEIETCHSATFGHW